MLLPLVGAARAAREVGLSRFRGAHASQKSTAGYHRIQFIHLKRRKTSYKMNFTWIFFEIFWRFKFLQFFQKKRMNYQHHLYNSSRFRAFSFQNRFFAVWSTGLTHSFWLVLICISMYLSNKKNPSCLGYIGYFTIYAYICYMGIIINYHKYSDTVNF